jgi:hypothetical protein
MENLLQNQETYFLDRIETLLNEALYPYGFQAPGHMNLETTKTQVICLFRQAKETIQLEGNQSCLKTSLFLGEVSYKICDLLSREIERYFMEKKLSQFYVVDFKCFSKLVCEYLLSQ